MPTKQWTDIFEAVANNDRAAVEELVKKRHVRLTNCNKYGETAAHVAASYGNLLMLKFMLEEEPSLLNMRDRANYTVLHRAVEKGALFLVKYLVDDCKADVYQPVSDVFGNSALHVAAETGQLEILKYFIEEKGMDASLKNYWEQPPAFSAAFNKQLHIVQYLVERQKVDVSGVDIRNNNILFLSVRRKDLRMAMYLLDDRRINLDVNWRGYLGKTIVYWAARIRRLDFLNYFVEEKNADINIPDDEGWTPLHFASSLGNLKAVRFLVRHKADIYATNKEGKTPVEVACQYYTISYLEGIMKRKTRRSRSLHHELVFQSMYSRTPICRWIGNTSAVESKPPNDNTYPQLDSFLTLTNVILRYVNKRSFYRKKHNSLFSPQQILDHRMDSTAMEVFDFRHF